MKKIIFLLFVPIFIISCGDNNRQLITDDWETNKNNNILTVNEQIESDLVISDDYLENANIHTDEDVTPQLIVDELIDITKNNFEENYYNRKVSLLNDISNWYINENIENIKELCTLTFYLTDLDTRPDFQLEIRQNYITKCKEELSDIELFIKNNANLID